MVFMTLGLALAVVMGQAAPAADRLNDRDIKALVGRIDDGRKKFKDALDDKIKHGVVRNESGEVDVSRFLDDFAENIERLEERFKPEYSASQEAATVLRQASTIDAYFRSQPPGTRGESEWNRLANDLRALAASFGTSFPLTSSAPVRRMGDHEVAAAAEEAAKAAKSLAKALDADLKKDPSVDKASRDRILGDAKGMEDDAKALRERLEDGKPSSAEAGRLLSTAASIQSFIQAHRPPGAGTVWSASGGYLAKIAAAYRTTWP